MSIDDVFIEFLDSFEKYRRLRSELDDSMTDGWFDLIEADRIGYADHISVDYTCYLRQEELKPRLYIINSTPEKENHKVSPTNVVNTGIQSCICIEDKEHEELVDELEKLKIENEKSNEVTLPIKEDDKKVDDETVRQRKGENIATTSTTSSTSVDDEKDEDEKEKEGDKDGDDNSSESSESATLSEPVKKSTIYDSGNDILAWFSLSPPESLQTAQSHFVKSVQKAVQLHQHRVELVQLLEKLENLKKSKRE